MPHNFRHAVLVDRCAVFRWKVSHFLLSLGPRLSKIQAVKGSATLAALFALNVPACAGRLLAILVEATASSGASGMSIFWGFLSMALFGFARSASILVASYSSMGQRWLDRFGAMSKSVPRITGIVLILLGLWSIRLPFSANKQR